MDFRCEALPLHGVDLIPPSSPDYAPLLADIEQRASRLRDIEPSFLRKITPVVSLQDSATSAILLNRNPQPIAALEAVWNYETVAGRTYRHVRSLLSSQSLLLPFGRRRNVMKLFGYWHTIFPGSKRYLSESGMVGDNSDVRPPGFHEKWFGEGSGMGRSRETPPDRDPIRSVTLALDSVFFLDGSFAGPDHEKLFEKTVADAEAHMLVARIAQDGLKRGLEPPQIFAEIGKVTGAAAEHPAIYAACRNPDASMEDFRRAALERLALQFMIRVGFRQVASEDQTVRCIMAWQKTPLPNFRKL